MFEVGLALISGWRGIPSKASDLGWYQAVASRTERLCPLLVQVGEKRDRRQLPFLKKDNFTLFLKMCNREGRLAALPHVRLSLAWG